MMDDVSSETCIAFIKKMNFKNIVWFIKAIIIIIIIIIIIMIMIIIIIVIVNNIFIQDGCISFKEKNCYQCRSCIK